MGKIWENHNEMCGTEAALVSAIRGAFSEGAQVQCCQCWVFERLLQKRKLQIVFLPKFSAFLLKSGRKCELYQIILRNHVSAADLFARILEYNPKVDQDR